MRVREGVTIGKTVRRFAKMTLFPTESCERCLETMKQISAIKVSNFSGSEFCAESCGTLRISEKKIFTHGLAKKPILRGTNFSVFWPKSVLNVRCAE